MNTNLTDLMHRATENLEPVTPDLLERSVQQGLKQRRRRTTILSLTGAGAVLATAGLIGGGIQLLNGPSNLAVAGTPVPLTKPSASAKPTQPAKPTSKPGSVTPEQTLATLRSFAEKKGKLSKPETWGGDGGFVGAMYVVDDGKGASNVQVMISGGGEANPCRPKRSGCTTLADGSSLYVSSEESEYSDSRQDKEGIVGNYVTLFRPDGRNLNFISFNGPAEKGQKHTRKHPLFSTTDLTAMAKSKAWKLPPVFSAEPSGTAKPKK
ncbi:hypothetical protein AB0L70_28615 [Kribbella sp. NPDC051952]|uniref:hypothetical protein n=1 Tax=Kribbella sp. NPDC051952 TaxID=3154851 RepID=UPI003429D931